MREIPNTNEIVSFMHCGLCLKQLPAGKSPREWAQLEVGWTKLGLQVWCRRHECNVLHVDFQGQRHPANVTMRLDTWLKQFRPSSFAPNGAGSGSPKPERVNRRKPRKTKPPQQ